MAILANTNAVDFQAADAAAVGEDATHVGLYSAANGGDFYGARPIPTDPAALVLGDMYQLPAGMVRITLPRGNFEEPFAVRILNLAAALTLYAAVHDGAAVGNEITDVDRVAISVWTVT